MCYFVKSIFRVKSKLTLQSRKAQRLVCMNVKMYVCVCVSHDWLVYFHVSQL